MHQPYDRSGVRADDIRFDPAWHHVMRPRGRARGRRRGVGRPAAGAQVARAAKFIGVAQVEAGSTCPLAMTYACVPALRLSPAVAAVWEPLVTGGIYDTRCAAGRLRSAAR